MNLKRIVAAVLAIIMLLALAACGEEKEEEQDESSSYSEFTSSEAVQIASEYVSDGLGGYDLLNRVTGRDDTASISVPDIGSASYTGNYVNDFNDKKYYTVEVKGTFSGYDDYGQFTEKYKFTINVKVAWNDRSPSSGDISIERAY